MNRDANHAQLDVLLDAIDAAKAADSLEAQAEAEERVVAALQLHLVLTRASLVLIRRFGAAMLRRTPLEPEGAGVVALEAARLPIDAAMLDDPEFAAACRRGLARLVLDLAPLQPPGLPNQAASAFLRQNGNQETWLAKPHRLPGIKAGTSARLLRDVMQLGQIVYHSAWHGVTQDAAAEAVLKHDDPVRRQRWKALQESRRVHKDWKPYLRACEEKAKRDKAARRWDPPAGAYEAAELERLADASVAPAAGKTITASGS
jgi:hypothetical protein